MPAAYLTPTDAIARLAAYGIDGSPTGAELRLASDDLDRLGRFVGEKADPAQHRAFPRDVTVQDDPPGVVPPRVLDWVALTAYQLSEEDEPPVTSERVDNLNVAYGGRGKRSKASRLKKRLLFGYRGAGPARIR
ncbi:MAG: hypothetical protein CYG60_07100 [Actinobacteria bacterium]|nr:MAG: hypothetical protein CYG60_07100 [Actinomycetota bacterium]